MLLPEELPELLTEEIEEWLLLTEETLLPLSDDELRLEDELNLPADD
jgi:hypothetical protein